MFRDGSASTRVTAKTALIIDGLQGSGNGFATESFLEMQPAPVRVCHHVHSAGLVLRAVSKGVPALVLMRAPEETALSVVGRWPFLSAPQVLRRYLHFYGRLLPVARQVEFGFFPEVTKDFPSVVRRLNARFGTKFEASDGIWAGLSSYDGQRADRVRHRDEASNRKRELDEPRTQALLRSALRLYAGLQEAAA